MVKDYNATGVVADMVAKLEGITVSDTSFTCSTPPECSLWAKAAANAIIPIAESGTFAPLTSSGGSSGQCLADGQFYNSDSDCCNLCDNTVKPSACVSCKSNGALCRFDYDLL